MICAPAWPRRASDRAGRGRAHGRSYVPTLAVTEVNIQRIKLVVIVVNFSKSQTRRGPRAAVALYTRPQRPFSDRFPCVVSLGCYVRDKTPAAPIVQRGAAHL